MNVKELTQDVKLIRVVVINGKDHNAAAINEGVEQPKVELAKDWVSIVAVSKDYVFIYARQQQTGRKMADRNSLSGLEVLKFWLFIYSLLS